MVILFYNPGMGDLAMPGNSQNTFLLTYMEPVVPKDAPGQATQNVSICWTKITSSIWLLRIPIAKTT